MILQVLHILAAVATLLTGVFALVKPAAITGFTGLQPLGGRGLTEIRAIFGGLFVALGLAPLILNHPTAYLVLGISYLALGVVRAVSIFIDKSAISSNWISLAVEIVFGVILVL